MLNNLKMFMLWATVLIFTASSANAATFTVISDANIKADKAQNKVTPSIDKLMKTINDTNLAKTDAILFLGNNTASANKYDLVMFAKITQRFNEPIYTVIGNKDVSKTGGLDKKKYFQLLNNFSKNKTKLLPCVGKVDDVVLLFMDGVNQILPTQRGYFRDEELIWLNKNLTKYKNKKVVIIQHFPVVSPSTDVSKETYNVQEYIKVLNKHNNVLAIVSGHFKVYDEVRDERGITHISIPSLMDNNEYAEISIGKKNSVSVKILDVN